MTIQNLQRDSKDHAENYKSVKINAWIYNANGAINTSGLVTQCKDRSFV